METHFIRSNKTILHVKCFGRAQNPPIILLHGFPEFWISYEPIVPYLEENFYLIIPDQRGYNLSSKPRDIRSYRMKHLIGDVKSLIDHFGLDQIVLVGHDWGGAVAWSVAQLYPQIVDKLVILNVPHPAVLSRYLYSSLSQLKKSWYMIFFQLPHLPEALASRNNWKILELAMVRSALPGTFSRSKMDQYKKAWSRPRAFQSMVNWYRAAFRRSQNPGSARILPETLILWGENDAFLNVEGGYLSLDLCHSGQIITTSASHWIQHEKPQWVAKEITDFVSS